MDGLNAQTCAANGEEHKQTPANETKRAFKPNLGRKLFRLKNLNLLQDTEENNGDSQLKKVLGTKDLVSLGVGSCVGTGMYLVSGMVAKKMAGPAVVLSYAIAGVAALFSGFCYAELGNRVPHTTGSAYVYSYVTVGEFIAFVIGWNMILEYIIGTAACACALSSCLDILSNGAISNITSAWSGPGDMMGDNPPDVLAFIITLLMMLIFFYGVRKSVTFNHIFNVFNLLSWLVIVVFGLRFARPEYWEDFMPFGFSGVLKGAATCFYAFIGFDIIATTGEEAKNPKDSIPKAILATIVIVTFAYVTCSSVMTLMVPYDKLSQDAGLVQIWGQIGYPSLEWLVSLGALGALTVSMFGSMFPMPRVAYAMAKDGLLFSVMAQVNKRGVPACANLWLSLLAAICALLFPLEVLIEMMSIGTLLAYTIVNSCVLILRYQPERKSLMDHFDMQTLKNCEETLDRKDYIEIPPEQTDQDRCEEQSSVWITIRDLIHGNHPTQKQDQCTPEGGRLVINVFFSLLTFVFLFDLVLILAEESVSGAGKLSLLFIAALIIICHTVAMAQFPQSRPRGFNAPGVPLVPILGIIINIYLMLSLSYYTLIRFSIWMLLGLVMYFKYGIWESSAEDWQGGDQN